MGAQALCQTGPFAVCISLCLGPGLLVPSTRVRLACSRAKAKLWDCDDKLKSVTFLFVLPFEGWVMLCE